MFGNGLSNKGFTLTILFWLESCIFYMDCFWKILNLYEIKDWNMHSCNTVWDQIFKRVRFKISFGLTLPYFHACPKPGLRFQMWYIWSFFMFYDLSWEVIVHFVSETCLNRTLSKPNTCLNWTKSSVPKGFSLDRFHCIGRIVDHYCLNFLFIILLFCGFLLLYFFVF
jgi:hypothetical protein